MNEGWPTTFIRKGSYRASGVKAWHPLRRYADKRRLEDIVARAVEIVRVQGNKEMGVTPVGTMRSGMVAYLPHPQVQRAPIGASPARTSPAVTAARGQQNQPQTRQRGSSTRSRPNPLNRNKTQANGSWSAPNMQLREGDPAVRRIGGLTGAGSQAGGKTQSFSTMLSNVGANKANGPGVFGVSASRLKAAKNFTMRPDTWLKRSAAVWMADFVAQGIRDWTGISKISWQDTQGEAKRKLAKHRTPNLAAKVGGMVASVPIAIGAFGFEIGASIGALFQDRSMRAQTGRVISAASEIPKWAASGFSGDNPFAKAAELERRLPGAIIRAEDRATFGAVQKFKESVAEHVRRQGDSMSLRGVGSWWQIGQRAMENEGIKAAFEKAQSSARNNVDWDAIRSELEKSISSKDG